MRIQLLKSTDPQWQTYLSQVRHDNDHTPEYHAAQDAFLGTTTQLIAVSEDENLLLVPIIFKEISSGLFDATSPSGLASPLISETATLEWRHDAIGTMISHLRDHGVVSLFLRSHPLFVSDLAEFAGFGGIVFSGSTYWIPLQQPLEEIRGRMRKNHQRNIRKARNDSLIAEHDSEWQYLEAFHQIYSQTMERLEVAPSYRFTKEYFQNLRELAGEKCSLWILKMDGQLAGAHFVTEVDGTVQYLYGATNPEFYRRVPQVAIFDAVLEWAHDRGNENYVLGGGMQESLLHFKAGFTDSSKPFATSRIVVNPVEYGRLCAEWEAENDTQVSALNEYFPAYRKFEDRVLTVQ